MKKLSLKSLKFNSQDKLQREQLKMVLGGGFVIGGYAECFEPNCPADDCAGTEDTSSCGSYASCQEILCVTTACEIGQYFNYLCISN